MKSFFSPPLFSFRRIDPYQRFAPRRAYRGGHPLHRDPCEQRPRRGDVSAPILPLGMCRGRDRGLWTSLLQPGTEGTRLPSPERQASPSRRSLLRVGLDDLGAAGAVAQWDAQPSGGEGEHRATAGLGCESGSGELASLLRPSKVWHYPVGVPVAGAARRSGRTGST